MKAAVLRESSGPLRIEDVAIDKPGPREILVRTVAAGLCHTDLHFMNGAFPIAAPAILGHESAGVVEAVGDDVTHVQPGDHVVTCLSMFCGHCAYCLSGRPALCDESLPLRTRGAAQQPRLAIDGQTCTQLLGVGAFAEQLLVHEHAIVKIREEMPLDRAALLGCAVTTGVGAVFRTAQVEPGSTVAVVGCGGVGLNCIQGALLAGASRVVAIDNNPGKLKLAELFGATDLVDASTGGAVEQVQAIFPGPPSVYGTGGVDYAFEAIGLKETAEQAFAMTKKGGTATIIGMIPLGVKLELPGISFLGEKKLQGSQMGSNRFRQDLPRFVDLYMGGRLKLDELVSRRLPLTDVNDGFAAMADGAVARSVLVFD